MKNIIILALVGLWAICGAQGQSIWTGAGTDSNWSTADNWQASVAPVPSETTTLNFDGSVTSSLNDLSGVSSFFNLTFATGASAFTLSGNPLDLYGTLDNNSDENQIIENDLTWTGSKTTLDTGTGGITLNGYLTSGAADSSFTKNGTGTLTLNGGGLFTVTDGSYISRINAGTLVINEDITFNRLDVQNGARMIVTNNATLSGFTAGYTFWQDSTIDLYSGRIETGNTLLPAQSWRATCNINVHGGVFYGEGSLRWANNGNVILTISGDGEFDWLAGTALAENGGAWIIMDGGLFKRGSTGSSDFDVSYILNGAGKKSTGTITNRLDFNAGVFATGSFTHAAKTNLHTSLNFNGGTVLAGKTTTTFFGAHPELLDSMVEADGIVFDTQDFSVTLNDALEAGVTSGGGLTKIGSGTLIIGTNATYTGTTIVSNGILSIMAPMDSSVIRLVPYSSAYLADTNDFSNALVVEENASFSFSSGAVDKLVLSSLSVGTSQGAGQLVFEITDTTALDQISVTSSGALDLTHVTELLLYQPGTTTQFSDNGAYPLISYAGTLNGSVNNLQIANPDPSKQYVFSDVAGVITLTISDGVTEEWSSISSGNWSTAANWSGGVPNAVNTSAQFLSAATSALTVTLDASATAGSLVFNNATASYTVEGSETLILEATSQQAALSVLSGSHTLSAPLSLSSDTLAQPESDATLTLAGPISGTGPLTVTGDGSIVLSGTNQTQTIVSDGTLSLSDGASLAGGSSVDNGTLVSTADTSINTAFEISQRGATIQPAADTTLSIATVISGEGQLQKESAGTLVLSSALGNAGGVLVSDGTLAFTNDVLGTLPLELGGGSAQYTGTTALSLSTPISVTEDSTLQTETAALTLTGDLSIDTTKTLSIESTNGIILAGSANISGADSKLQLVEGTLTLASGADYTLSNDSRENVQIGRDANKTTELIIEEGARLKTGGIHINTTSATSADCESIVRQNGGSVEVTYGDGLFIRDYGTSDGTYLMNGGSFDAPVSSWTSIGSKGRGFLTVNGGTMNLGRIAMGVKNEDDYSFGGPGGYIAVNNGVLNINGQFSWMSDTSRTRYNSLTLGDGTPDQGQLNLVATTRSTPYANGGGRSALVFNGAVLNATGLAPYDSSSLTDYLYGADSLSIHSGGAIVKVDADDITFTQPVLAAGTSGGVIKRGAASLTLSATNNAWCGSTDVQEGTLCARMNQALQHTYPEGLMALWTFDDGTPADQSGNGYDMMQQNDTNLVEFTDGGFCGKAALFSGKSSLKMGYDQVFDVNTFTVSAWVNFATKDAGHQGILSTRVNTDEISANGSFDFKMNGSAYTGEPSDTRYIASYTPWQTGVPITPAMGGDLDVGVWYMVTYTVQDGKIDAYLNGIWRNGNSNVLTPNLLTGGHIMTLGRGHSTETAPVREMMGNGGMIDDVAIYNRVLSADEIAAMYETMQPRSPVSVAADAELNLMGSTNITPTVTGGGVISDGTLVVTETLSPEGNADAAILTIANLVLDGSNLVYNCSTDDITNDLIHVTGLLSVEQTGTIDFGRSSEDAVSTPFRRTVMTYDTLDPADALKIEQWNIIGDGANSALKRNIIVDTVNKHIDVEIRYVGTVIIVR